MKNKIYSSIFISIAAVLIGLTNSSAAFARHYHHHYYGGYGRVIYSQPVVIERDYGWQHRHHWLGHHYEYGPRDDWGTYYRSY